LKAVAAVIALNEERTIAKVIAHATRHVEKILIVDGGSRDDTALIAEAMGAEVIRHDRSLGKEASLRSCFEWAKTTTADVLITLEGGGYHYASFIPALLTAIQEKNADIAVGSRSSRTEGLAHSRRVGGRGFDKLSVARVGGRVVDSQSGFRAFSRRAIESVVAAENEMEVDTGILTEASKGELRIIEVPIAMIHSGKELLHSSPFHALDALFSIVKFTSIRHPFLFYGGFGAASLIVSLVFGVLALDYYRKYGQLVTNLALISVATGIVALLSLFTGVLLFTIITVIRENRQ
jgi:glycosyltransferase involved in cell wall biosynthesis